MSAIGSAMTFALGAAIGVAGGIAASRLVAPQSGEDTQETVGNLRQEIVTAGEVARAEREAALNQRFRNSVGQPRAQAPS